MIADTKRELIKRLLAQDAFTQKEIAELSGVGLRTIERIASEIRDEEQKEKLPSCNENTNDNNSISENNSNTSTDDCQNEKNGKSVRLSKDFARLIYPTKEQYEKWFEEHQTYIDEETGEIIDTPYYDGCDGYGQTPDDWLELLDNLHVPMFVSPLHACDVNPDGKVKKPHYHILLMFDKRKSQRQVDKMLECVKAVGREEVQSVRGYARYLKHLDNPEKFQYTDNVIELCGADYTAAIATASDKYKMLGDIFEYAAKNRITSFARLVLICRQNNTEWFNAICNGNAYCTTEFLKSLKWTLRQKDEKALLGEMVNQESEGHKHV